MRGLRRSGKGGRIRDLVLYQRSGARRTAHIISICSYLGKLIGLNAREFAGSEASGQLSKERYHPPPGGGGVSGGSRALRDLTQNFSCIKEIWIFFMH